MTNQHKKRWNECREKMKKICQRVLRIKSVQTRYDEDIFRKSLNVFKKEKIFPTFEKKSAQNRIYIDPL